MTDLREAVARMVSPLTWRHRDRGETYEGLAGSVQDSFDLADEILATAEPIIRADERRKVIAELVEKAHTKACQIVHRESDASTEWLEVPDWLRAQQEAGQ